MHLTSVKRDKLALGQAIPWWIVGVLLLFWIQTGLSFPSSNTGTQVPNTYAPPSNSTLNGTNADWPIYCYGGGLPSFYPCSQILDSIREYPNFKRPQRFKMGESPAEPVPPPYKLSIPGNDCAIGIICVNPLVADIFSWEQIVRSATAIINECYRRYGGGGGDIAIGGGLGWTVSVRSVYGERPGNNITLLTNGTTID